jgi:hypothetical protein
VTITTDEVDRELPDKLLAEAEGISLAAPARRWYEGLDGCQKARLLSVAG